MIPAANITAWRRQAPWPTDTQVEQDLILSRLIVEIAQHELLGQELAFRGGTCLHKLCFPAPARYSEDLDYVRRTESGIGEYLDALTEIASSIGLRRLGTDAAGRMASARFQADPTSGAGLIKVKIEINIAETESFRERVEIPFGVNSPWWTGAAAVSTFKMEELLGTKLRALYQRSKGRDLFDLWCAMTKMSLDFGEVVAAFRHYIGEDEFTFPQLARNLEAKLGERDFREDLMPLVQAPPQTYDMDAPADMVMLHLGGLLRNAPDHAELEREGWRLR